MRLMSKLSGRHQRQQSAFGEFHAALWHLAHTDFRPLQILQNRHRLVEVFRNLPNHGDRMSVIVVAAVREV
jgi:hypothetical protein